MKKTIPLLALMAAFAVSASAATVLNVASFSVTSADRDSGVTVNNTGDVVLDLKETMMYNNGDVVYSPVSTAYYQYNASHGAVLTPAHNIGNGDGKYWTMTFTLTNNSANTVSIESIAIAAFGTNGSGGVQGISGGMVITSDQAVEYNYVGREGNAQNKPIDFTLTGSSEVIPVNMGMNPNNWSNPGREATFTLDNSWTLDAGESMEFTVKAENSNLFTYTSGTFAGLKTITINGAVVPEAATASLSLLGLAALMMRRRRA